MKRTPPVSTLAAAALLTGAMGCSSTSSSSSSSPPPSGCDVTFANVQAAGATLLTAPFHDSSSDALFWNPRLKHLDVLGGDVADRPARAFELELYGAPIVDGAAVALRLPDPADPLVPTPRLTLVDGDAAKMTSIGGTVHFATASTSRLVFTVDGATMVTLDSNNAVVAGAPSLTMSMTCALAATADP